MELPGRQRDSKAGVLLRGVSGAAPVPGHRWYLGLSPVMLCNLGLLTPGDKSELCPLWGHSVVLLPSRRSTLSCGDEFLYQQPLSMRSKDGNGGKEWR